MKIAIVGLGNRGKKFLQATALCVDATVVAVCDPTVFSSADIVKDQNIALYDDIDLMLEKESIDIAIVAVPHHLYLAIITKLAVKKIHIIKEKPFALSPEEARQMHQVLQENGVEMMVAVQRRFDNHYQVFKSMLPNLGKISHIRGSCSLNIERLDEGWRANKQYAGGGVLSDLGYHFIDLLIWCFGEPSNIACFNTNSSKANQEYDVEDSALLNFEFMQNANNVSQKTIGSFFLSRVSVKPGEEIIVQGQYGCIHLTPNTMEIYNVHNRKIYTSVKQDSSKINPIAEMVEHFVHYLNGDILDLVSDYKTHFKHVNIIKAAYQSDRAFLATSYGSIKQKIVLQSVTNLPGKKRERDDDSVWLQDNPANNKHHAIAVSAEKNPDFEWPIITERTKQCMLAQMTAENISCYNRSGIIEKFENNFAKYHGRRYALSTNSGTSAIHALYFSLQLAQGDEVLVPNNTFHATISPLMHTGAFPIFVDCLPNGNIDPSDLQNKITAQTKAIMITHMWGIPCAMDEIVSISKQHGIKLLEDCSHAHGATYKGQLVGTFGDAAAWSLNAQKIISGGEGGILLTDDKDIEVRCNMLGQYNKRAQQVTPNDHELRSICLTGMGLKHRITTVSAAMADEQFEHLDEWLKYKRLYASMFRQALADIPFIRLPDISHTQPAWYAFTFYIEPNSFGVERDQFVRLLHVAGLGEIQTPKSTQPQMDLPLYNMPSTLLPQWYKQNPPASHACPMSKRVYNSCIKMPMWARACDLEMVNKYINGIRNVALHLLKGHDDKQLSEHNGSVTLLP